LGPALKRFWDESVVEYRKKNQALPSLLPNKARRQGPATTEGDFNEPFDDLFMPPPFDDPMDPMMNPIEDGVMEPEVFRAAPDLSLRSFETPSQLPWHHSRAGSTTNGT
jgi:hypothetical protein